jgi:hypothetical protein
VPDVNVTPVLPRRKDGLEETAFWSRQWRVGIHPTPIKRVVVEPAGRRSAGGTYVPHRQENILGRFNLALDVDSAGLSEGVAYTVRQSQLSPPGSQSWFRSPEWRAPG